MVVAVLTGLEQQRATRSSRQAQHQLAAWACVRQPRPGWAPALLARIPAGSRGEAPKCSLARAGHRPALGTPAIAPPAHLESRRQRRWHCSASQQAC